MSARVALVTNDDGVSSEGLRWLAMTAADFGLDVVVAAPLRESSGTSASLTAVQVDEKVVVEERALADLDHVRVYGVDAAPGFITLIATRGAFGRPPDVVLSGINRGLNTGHAVLHSGTVGAAMTAGAHGCRALAVSIGAAESVFWETAVPVVERSLPLLLELDRAVVLNVNVPNVPVDELRGLKQGSLAAFGMVQTTIDQRGEGFVRLSVAAIESELESGTDAALVAAGFASVTPLEPLCEVADLRLRLEPNPQPTS